MGCGQLLCMCVCVCLGCEVCDIGDYVGYGGMLGVVRFTVMQ